MLRFLFNAIPDLHYTLDQTMAEGDLVAVNTTATGAAKGDFFGHPGIQHNVQFKQMFFFRLAKGKITEEWEVVDVAGIREQLAKP
jgi:predicted ester cyclase